MSSIKKLVIPVAGLGTRFLPATKSQPKEMMPVVDKPIIQYVVEDAVRSGITDIVMVVNSGKDSVQDHFSPDYDFEKWLKDHGKDDKAKMIREISDLANFVFVRQKGPYGNGTPVLCAKSVIGNDPFAVMWGDEFFHTPNKPQLSQLIEVYDKYESPVLTGYEVDEAGTSKYGIIDGNEIEQDIFEVKGIVEKPGPDKAPSNLASLGGFILTPDIFDELENTEPGKDNELWLVDAIFELSKKRQIYSKKIEGTYYDTGAKLGYLKANIDWALRDKNLEGQLRKYLQTIV